MLTGLEKDWREPAERAVRADGGGSGKRHLPQECLSRQLRSCRQRSAIAVASARKGSSTTRRDKLMER